MTDKENFHPLVPENEKGNKKDLSFEISTSTTVEAEDWFIEAKVKLLDIGGWNEWSKDLKVNFSLTNATGNIIRRPARKANYIRLEMPDQAPNNYDWEYIEAIEYDDYPDEERETIAMRVRTSVSPVAFQKGITYTFNDDATTTFVIERIGTKITAHYHRRNEIPDTNKDIIDSVKNISISVGAWSSVTDTEWKSLLKGILELPAEQ